MSNPQFSGFSPLLGLKYVLFTSLDSFQSMLLQLNLHFMFSSNVTRSYLRQRCQAQYNLFSYIEWLVSGLNTWVSSAWYHPSTKIHRPRRCYFWAFLCYSCGCANLHLSVAAMRGSMFCKAVSTTKLRTLRFWQNVPHFKQIAHITPIKKSRIAYAIEDTKEMV